MLEPRAAASPPSSSPGFSAGFCFKLASHPQQLCLEWNNYEKGLWCQSEKKQHKNNKTKLQPPNLRRLGCARAPARSASRGFYFLFLPLNKMSKMYLMRSSPLTNEAVICQKRKMCYKLSQSSSSDFSPARSSSGSWAGGGARVPSTAAVGNRDIPNPAAPGPSFPLLILPTGSTFLDLTGGRKGLDGFWGVSQKKQCEAAACGNHDRDVRQVPCKLISSPAKITPISNKSLFCNLCSWQRLQETRGCQWQRIRGGPTGLLHRCEEELGLGICSGKTHRAS